MFPKFLFQFHSPEQNPSMEFSDIIVGMELATGLVLGAGTCHIERGDLLFTRCPRCYHAVTWRHHKTYFLLIATCCALVFVATPTDSRATSFEVKRKLVSKTNVRPFKRERK